MLKKLIICLSMYFIVFIVHAADGYEKPYIEWLDESGNAQEVAKTALEEVPGVTAKYMAVATADRDSPLAGLVMLVYVDKERPKQLWGKWGHWQGNQIVWRESSFFIREELGNIKYPAISLEGQTGAVVVSYPFASKVSGGESSMRVKIGNISLGTGFEAMINWHIEERFEVIVSGKPCGSSYYYIYDTANKVTEAGEVFIFFSQKYRRAGCWRAHTFEHLAYRLAHLKVGFFDNDNVDCQLASSACIEWEKEQIYDTAKPTSYIAIDVDPQRQHLVEVHRTSSSRGTLYYNWAEIKRDGGDDLYWDNSGGFSTVKAKGRKYDSGGHGIDVVLDEQGGVFEIHKSDDNYVWYHYGQYDLDDTCSAAICWKYAKDDFGSIDASADRASGAGAILFSVIEEMNSKGKPDRKKKKTDGNVSIARTKEGDVIAMYPYKGTVYYRIGRTAYAAPQVLRVADWDDSSGVWQADIVFASPQAEIILTLQKGVTLYQGSEVLLTAGDAAQEYSRYVGPLSQDEGEYNVQLSLVGVVPGDKLSDYISDVLIFRR